LRSNDEIALQPVSISHHGRYDQTIALKFKVFYLRPSLDFSFKRVQFYMHPLMRSFFRFDIVLYVADSSSKLNCLSVSFSFLCIMSISNASFFKRPQSNGLMLH
jgi:hypothetical protein